MKIGIDARTCVGLKAGKGQYTYHLILTLAKLDQKNQYLLYTRGDLDFKKELPGNFTVRKIKAPSIFWHLLCLAQIIYRDKIDLFLATSSYIIPALLKNCVVIIPDLVSFLKIEKHQRKASLIEKLTLKKAMLKAKKIIAISYSTKNDIIRCFQIPEEKVIVVHLAAPTCFYPRRDQRQIKKVLEKYRLPQKFILFVSTLEPRKNIVRLIKAYARLLKKNKELKKYSLVLVGKKGWYYKEIFDTVKRLKLKKDIIFTGFVPEQDLPFIYNAASLFIFPSLYEGFGIPLLEALSCGVPCITSKTSSLPEVGGRAVLYVDPYDIKEIAWAMKRVLTDQTLAESLREAGFEQIKKFSWEKTAKRVLEVFK